MCPVSKFHHKQAVQNDCYTLDVSVHRPLKTENQHSILMKALSRPTGRKRN
eukprot:CAMPEP_0177434038 /NCGR_PEP_ID=MMETSP0369-20130122/183_1 /TAXON_ID=447022 ORGANISM="Scrippsiella hangoei-like, Strain SHHI-4" /NCGR_SAMPLE_ID=MMETSP0369 /ASSEMBLY_ACC=CAM_ASM_000364 /LENGTH=50 /DNA_ID=CAMNT_0018904861 /DNA_START=211 /DNA_END=360 /DNA_ORIENTATION=-